MKFFLVCKVFWALLAWVLSSLFVQNMPEAKKEILENMEETKATLGLKALSVLR